MSLLLYTINDLLTNNDRSYIPFLQVHNCNLVSQHFNKLKYKNVLNNLLQIVPHFLSIWNDGTIDAKESIFPFLATNANAVVSFWSKPI